MNTTNEEELLDVLEEIGAIVGVRGALMATSEGALAGGDRSGLAHSVANDVARTVRRMTVASETVGVPLRELLINFGPARMLVTPLTEDAAIVVLLERDTAVTPVRSLIAVQINSLRELLGAENLPPGDDGPHPDPNDPLARVMSGELGPALMGIGREFSDQFVRSGGSPNEANLAMVSQVRDWLRSCNPSPYTLPLLVDGLGQLLASHPAQYGTFMARAQAPIRKAQGELP